MLIATVEELTYFFLRSQLMPATRKNSMLLQRLGYSYEYFQNKTNRTTNIGNFVYFPLFNNPIYRLLEMTDYMNWKNLLACR